MREQESLIDTLAVTLLHSLWQGAVTALLLMALLAFCPRSRPDLRCLMATVSLGALGCWMVLTFYQALPASPIPVESASPLTATTAVGELMTPGTGLPSTATVSTTNWRKAMVCVWLIGATIGISRWLVGALGVMRLRKCSREVVDVELLKHFEKVRCRVGARQPISLRVCDGIESPLTFGWLRPVVLVPTSLLSALPVAHLEAIFAHELMHVRRADFVFNLLISVFRSALFYHPAVWWMAKVIQTERKMTCDLGAMKKLRSTVSNYASALMAIEDWRAALQCAPPARTSLAMCMRDGTGLLARVERLALARQRGAISTPLNVPVMIIFVLTSVSVLAGWQLAGTDSAKGLVSHSIDRNMIDPPFFHRASDVDIAIQLLKAPVSWPLPASESRLMRPPLVLAVNGVAKPFGKNDPPVFGDIPNAWIIRHGLDYLDAGVADRDGDRDGFSAAEEYAAGTHPADASSHPPLIDKLRFIERKQQLYRIEFAAQPDSNTFQINRLPSARWEKKAMLLSVGETSEDGQIEILAWADGELSVRFLETDQVYQIGKGERTALPIEFGIFELNIGSGESYTVRVGDSFVLGIDGGAWTFKSRDPSGVTLIGTENQKLVRIEAGLSDGE